VKVHIFSDLHLDAVTCEVPSVPPGIDCVVVAGDTQQSAVLAMQTFRMNIPMQIPIIMVCGNHEYYRTCLPHELAAARAQAPFQAIHLLENDVAIVGGTRFIGATIWTDYCLYGEAHRHHAMDEARRWMNDHRKISWAKEPWQRFRPQEAAHLHAESRSFIETMLAIPFDGPTCIVTHHAPAATSLDPQFGNVLLNAAYASDLTALIKRHQPDLWIHGHIHKSSDYRIGRTRVVANPHGYGWENPAFDPALIIEFGN
jgi:Icc-related predicted phosphoesterase